MESLIDSRATSGTLEENTDQMISQVLPMQRMDKKNPRKPRAGHIYGTVLRFLKFSVSQDGPHLLIKGHSEFYLSA